MKLILILICLTVLLFLGCESYSAEEQLPDFIPGTYTTEWTTEFTEGRDTIFIQPLSREGSNGYQIARRTFLSFQNKPQYKLVNWTGSYNRNDKTIVINKNGRILFFDVKRREMRMGSTVYKKL